MPHLSRPLVETPRNMNPGAPFLPCEDSFQQEVMEEILSAEQEDKKLEKPSTSNEIREMYKNMGN